MPCSRDRVHHFRDRGTLVPAPRRKLKLELWESELRFRGLEPGDLLGGRETEEAQDIKPRVGPAVQVEKEEAFGRLDGGGEPVENGEPGAEEQVGLGCSEVSRNKERK